MLQISGAEFDRPPCSVETKLFLCSTSRTGSNLLCRALIHHGIGIPHEYFNFFHAAIIGPRLDFAALSDGSALSRDLDLLRAYLAAVVERRTVNGTFAAKLSWWQYERVLDNPVGHSLLNGGHFVYLYRENLLDQAISNHIATLTGVWGPGDTVTTRPAPDPNFLDRRAIALKIELLAQHSENWRKFFARNDIEPLFISYEQLTSDLPGAVRAIAATIGLGPATIEAPYEEEKPSDRRVPSVSKIKADFLAGHQRVHSAPRPAARQTEDRETGA
jgi:LPS sulfotransferase NodH